MQNQTSHKTTNNTTPHLDDEIKKKTQKKKLDIYVNHLFRLREKGKKMYRGDSRSKNDLKPPLLDEQRRKKV
jgi:hypothetical protein